MPSKYWIKLYHEILDDPKMGRMPDVLFARCIKLFLIAGDCGEDSGRLPPLDDVAWRLRLQPEEIESDLIELQKLGITAQKDGIWRITNWKNRQGPMSDVERSRRYRQDRQKQEYHDHGPAYMGAKTANPSDTERKPTDIVTNDVTTCDAESDTDTDIESKDSARAPSKSSKKKPTKTQPAAVKEFRDKAHRFPNKSWWELIDETVGEAEKDLDLWGEIVFNWVGLGWNPMNVSGMLEFYQRREIPSNQYKHNIPQQRTIQSAKEFLDDLRQSPSA